MSHLASVGLNFVVERRIRVCSRNLPHVTHEAGELVAPKV
jgi:hypothetical protein